MGIRLELERISKGWQEYRNLATIAAEDWDHSRIHTDRGGDEGSDLLLQLSATILLLKGGALLTETTVGIGLIGLSKYVIPFPWDIPVLVTGGTSLILATQDFIDIRNAFKILSKP